MSHSIKRDKGRRGLNTWVLRGNGETYSSNGADYLWCRLFNKIKPLSNVTSFELNDGSVVFHSIKRGDGA